MGVQWDMSGDGKISKKEFLEPQHGLLAHIRRDFHRDTHQRLSEVRTKPLCPWVYTRWGVEFCERLSAFGFRLSAFGS